MKEVTNEENIFFSSKVHDLVKLNILISYVPYFKKG